MKTQKEQRFLPMDFPSRDELRRALAPLPVLAEFGFVTCDSRETIGQVKSPRDVLHLIGDDDQLLVFQLPAEDMQGPVVDVHGYTGDLGGGQRDLMIGPTTLLLNHSHEQVETAILSLLLAYEQRWRATSALPGTCNGMAQLAAPLRRDGVSHEQLGSGKPDPLGFAQLFPPRFFGYPTIDSLWQAEVYQLEYGGYRIPGNWMHGDPDDDSCSEVYVDLTDLLNLAMLAGKRDVAAILLRDEQTWKTIPELAGLFDLPPDMPDLQRGAIVYAALCNWEENAYQGAPEVPDEQR